MICGLCTSPRPNGVSYLRQTTLSLLAAGATRVFVFAEPGAPINEIADVKDAVITCNESRLGNWGNWVRMATSLTELSKGQNVLTAEDDIQFSNNAVQTADSLASSLGLSHTNRFGFLAVYTSSIYQKIIPDGVHEHRAASLFGACALAWTAKSLRAVSESKTVRTWRGISGVIDPPETRHIDTCIGKACIDLGLGMYFMKPCLAQHTGIVSGLRATGAGSQLQAERVI